MNNLIPVPQLRPGLKILVCGLYKQICTVVDENLKRKVLYLQPSKKTTIPMFAMSGDILRAFIKPTGLLQSRVQANMLTAGATLSFEFLQLAKSVEIIAN